MAVIITQGEDADPLLGAVVAETYRVVRLIGSGGMGRIYEAHHIRLPKKVAIKVMTPRAASDAVAFERFRREAETVGALGHRHIAKVLDFNVLPEGAPFMVMEYLDGEDLGARLDRETKLSAAAVIGVVVAVSDALASAHAEGVVHRDIKPSNIFFARQEEGDELVKLLDFGTAMSKTKPAVKLTVAGTIVGTPWYMSPEQARGHELDARTDQFSLAILAYEALAGCLPFHAADPVEVIRAIVENPYPSIRGYVPELPASVDAVLERALAKDRADRFSSVMDFAQAFRTELEAATPVPVAPPVPARLQEGEEALAAPESVHVSAATKWTWLAIGLLLLLGLAGLALLPDRESKPTPSRTYGGPPPPPRGQNAPTTKTVPAASAATPATP